MDGDGRDEVFCGTLALDDDLSPLWSSQRGHGDAQHLAEYDPTHEGMEYLVVHEREPYGMTLFDAATGEELFHVDAEEDTGRCMMAATGSSDGFFEVWARELGNRYVSFGGSNLVEDGARPISVNFRIFWDGDLYDELLDGESLEGNCPIAIYDGDGSVLEQLDGLTNNGTKNNVCLAADLLGDWREEVVVRSSSGDALLIYVTTIPTEHRLYTLMHDRAYRMQVAAQNTGYNQPAHLSYCACER